MRERGNISARISVHWRAQCHAKWPSSQCSKTMLPLVGVGATKILDSFIIWFSKRFGIWKEFFRSFLDQFVSDLDRLSVLSIFKFDPVWFMSCSTTIFDGQCCLSVCEHSRLENLCRFWIKKRLLKLDCFADLMVGPGSVVRFPLFKHWIIWMRCSGFCFGCSACSLLPWTPLKSPWKTKHSAHLLRRLWCSGHCCAFTPPGTPLNSHWKLMQFFRLKAGFVSRCP